MKRLLLSFIFVLATLPGWSQSSFNRYSSRITKDGICYFFKEQKLNSVSGMKKFTYDMTYPDWTDSIIVNFSMYCNIPDVPQKLSIRSGDKVYVCYDFRSLYVDLLKDGYEIRITSRFAKDDIVSLLQQSEYPMVFEMETKGINIYAKYKGSAWRKDRKKLNDIFLLINSIK